LALRDAIIELPVDPKADKVRERFAALINELNKKKLVSGGNWNPRP
jgi:hypothetical protein